MVITFTKTNWIKNNPSQSRIDITLEVIDFDNCCMVTIVRTLVESHLRCGFELRESPFRKRM